VAKITKRASLVRTDDGYEYFDTLSAAAILPILDDGRIVMVRQFRPAVGCEMLEIPAGTLDIPGERPVDCAGRELMEETGYKAGEIYRLGTMVPSCGRSNEVVHLFVGQRLTEVERPPADDVTEPVIVGLKDLRDLLMEGSLTDSKALTALLLFDRGYWVVDKRTE